MSIVGKFTGEGSEGRLVTIASSPGLDTFHAERLSFIAFDLPSPIID